jgi:prepilin-type processing-associated H-X9-DG protein
VAQRRAFTLTEVLVLAGVLGVATMVFAPALTRNRAHADAARCASNLREIGQGFARHVGENGNLYPPSYVYPSDASGSWDPNNQPPQHPFGYRHWSRIVFDTQAPCGLFECPAVANGGAPRTNPGPLLRDWEPMQVDQNAQTSPNPLTDMQAPRMSYTANGALVPRNQFTPQLSGGPRWNRFVSEYAVRDLSHTILVTEFSDHWNNTATLQPGPNTLMSRSHRPVNAFWNVASGGNPYQAPPSGGFTHGDAFQEDYGLLPVNTLRTFPGVIEGIGSPAVNAVGRHHPGGDFLGGTTNFLYGDGHVDRKTVLETMRQREWGERFHSLTGPNTHITEL